MTVKRAHRTREAWLVAAIDSVRPLFKEAVAPLPKVIHVSVGFGYNGRAENRTILAQAWEKKASDDGAPTVFISPVIATTDDALGALVHELVHVADDCQHGHGRDYRVLGETIGLEGKPTEMLPGVALAATLITISETLGAYPHSKLNVDSEIPGEDGEVTQQKNTAPSRQTNRHLACTCMNVNCTAVGYVLRTSNKWLNVAVPFCPVCKVEMTVC